MGGLRVSDGRDYVLRVVSHLGDESGCAIRGLRLHCGRGASPMIEG